MTEAPSGISAFEQAQERLRALRVREAITLFHAAEQAGYPPDECAAGRWTCWMLEGRFGRAWNESDAIERRANPDPHRFWDGESLEGKCVLIRCLHGLGDTLQFIRYASLLRPIVRELTIEAQPKLQGLLSYSGLADRVMSWGDREPAWEKQVEVVELPRIFRTEVDSIPAAIPYLWAPPVSQSLPQGSKMRVGIVWSASNYNPARSVPVGELDPLFEIDGVEWFSLQAGFERYELAQREATVRQLYEEGQTLLETAGHVLALDLLITVDTMTAHLAGGLGQKVWTLLPYFCDWRWMLGRDDSPWYPNMRLYRQRQPGDWRSVLAQVKCDLMRAMVNRR